MSRIKKPDGRGVPKFISPEDMAVARRDRDVTNSILKREKLPGYCSMHAWSCGCCFALVVQPLPPPPHPRVAADRACHHMPR